MGDLGLRGVQTYGKNCCKPAHYRSERRGIGRRDEAVKGPSETARKANRERADFERKSVINAPIRSRARSDSRSWIESCHHEGADRTTSMTGKIDKAPLGVGVLP